MDYYGLLGLHPEAGLQEVRQAYRSLARTLHPDANKDSPDAVARFKEVTEAYNTLSDPTRRAAYDKQREQYRRRAADGGSGLAPEAEEFAARVPRGPRVRGRDIEVSLEVPFSFVRFGGQSSVQVPGLVVCDTCKATGAAPGTKPKTCTTCKGRGAVSRDEGQGFTFAGRCPECRGEGRVIEMRCPECRGEGIVRGFRDVAVDVPPGVHDRQSLRLVAQGEPGEGGAAPGDVVVQVHVPPHPVFTRNGADLSVTLPVSITEALLGATVQVPTLDGVSSLRLPENTPHGAALRLRGMGLPRTEGETGDLVVLIELRLPHELSRRARKAAEALADALSGEGQRLRAEMLQRARGAGSS